jgi:hypothetical protein
MQAGMNASRPASRRILGAAAGRRLFEIVTPISAPKSSVIGMPACAQQIDLWCHQRSKD